MTKVPVLVTGGAGYIGSHAVLALRDGGWPAAVIDDLSNGTRALFPTMFLSSKGRSRTAAWSTESSPGRNRRDPTLRGLDRGPGIGRKAARLLRQQHARQPRPDFGRGGRRRAAHRLFLDRGGVRRARAGADRGGRSQAAHQSLRRVETDDRADAGRRGGCLSGQLRRAALFQRRRGRPGRARRTDRQGLDPSDQGRGRGGGGQARPCRRVRHRLSDSRRDLRARLCARQRSRRRPCRRARAADRAARWESRAELRVRQRTVGPRGARRARPRGRRARPARNRAAAGG